MYTYKWHEVGYFFLTQFSARPSDAQHIWSFLLVLMKLVQTSTLVTQEAAQRPK